jgi:hypothetical protein
MKTYISILIVIVGLAVVVAGGYMYTKKYSNHPPLVLKKDVDMKTYSGEVVRVFEGDNVISYSFDIPEAATTTVGMDGALIKITNDATPYAAMYISYEGGRGYTPSNYLNKIIAPHVSVINPTGQVTIGSQEWYKAESPSSEWYIAQVKEGNWLIVVENKKVNHDLVEKTLASVEVN